MRSGACPLFFPFVYDSESGAQIRTTGNRVSRTVAVQNPLGRRNSVVCHCRIYGYSDNAAVGPGDAEVLAEIQRSRAVNQPCLPAVKDDLMLRIVKA